MGLEVKKLKDYQKMRLTKHHLFWPRREYRTPLEIEFRNLPCNIVSLPDYLHQMLHKLQDPPEKPPVEFMEEMVRLYSVDGLQPDQIYNAGKRRRTDG